VKGNVAAQQGHGAERSPRTHVAIPDVDLAELARRRIELAQAEKIAVARLNTLAHRAPDIPLPPPPRAIEEPIPLPEAPLLWQAAGE
jgi:hypothetical protein